MQDKSITDRQKLAKPPNIIYFPVTDHSEERRLVHPHIQIKLHSCLYFYLLMQICLPHFFHAAYR